MSDETTTTTQSGEQVLPAARIQQLEAKGMAALEAAFQRFTTPLSSGQMPTPMPRGRITFEVNPEDCLPDVFAEPFTLTMATLTSGQEVDAARQANADPVVLGMAMARASLEKFNGMTLDPIKREFLWEALGQAGRQLAMAMFAKIGTPADGVAGKVSRAIRIE